MTTQIIEGESSSVWGWVGGDCFLVEVCGEFCVDAEGVIEGVDGVLLSDVLAVVGEITVVGEGIEHWAGGADYYFMLTMA